MSNNQLEIIETIPGWSHNITSCYRNKRIVILWANEIFDRENPDTIFTRFRGKDNEKIKIVTVVGTRPEIIRLSCIFKKLDEYCEHIMVHTGQNYDFELNEIFLMILT